MRFAIFLALAWSALAQPPDEKGAAAAFEAFVPVLHNPRCINCHSVGDFAREGDDHRPHAMDVRRGPHGDGIDTVKCSACHSDRNTPGIHTPPGAPGWHLPSPDLPMIWEGLSDRQLCELLKDPKRNGQRTPQQIVSHMSTPLVQWAWHPGDGRAAVPMPQSEFLAQVKAWVDKGAGCPAN